jgi:hypothetical protein
MVQNMHDTAAIHPSFTSVELAPDGSMQNVTIFSYQRLKFELYQIAAPILENIRLHQESTRAKLSDKVIGVHGRLLAWFSRLPPELRLDQLQTTTLNDKSSVESIFGLQALALQLAYDNIQIILHKPMLSTYDGKSRASGPRSDTFNGALGAGDVPTPSPSHDSTTISKVQCWASALRTSRLASHKRLLQIAMSTHAASFIGMHLFTAGMVLSTVALSQPLSSQAQETKYAVSQIIKTLNLLKNQTLLSKQSVNVLEAVVKVLLEKEWKRITLGDFSRVGSPSIDESRLSNVLEPANLAGGCGSDVNAPLPARISNPSEDMLNDVADFQFANLYEQLGQTDATMLTNTDLQEGISDIQGGE